MQRRFDLARKLPTWFAGTRQKTHHSPEATMNESTSAPDSTPSTKSQIKEIIDEICAASPAATEAACLAKDKAIAAGRKVVDTVRRHPVEATVIAVGAGLLVWWLMTRRNHE